MLDIQKTLESIPEIVVANGENTVAVDDGSIVAGKQCGKGDGDTVGAGTAFARHNGNAVHKPVLFAVGVAIVPVFARFTMVTHQAGDDAEPRMAVQDGPVV